MICLSDLVMFFDHSDNLGKIQANYIILEIFNAHSIACDLECSQIRFLQLSQIILFVDLFSIFTNNINSNTK